MTDALERVEQLLEPGRLAAAPRVIDGYLDVLAPEAAAPAGLGNALMHNPALAAVYQRLWRPAFTRLFSLGGSGTLDAHNELIDELSLSGERRILDVGCGPGLYTRPLARRLDGAGLAVGLDVSAAMLRRATVDNPGSRIGYLRGNALDLPFPDETFDVVVCLAALYLMPDPWVVVREMARVTAPGGRVAIFTSLATPLNRSIRTPMAHRITGFRWFTRSEITGWLRADGLADITQTVRGQSQFVRAVKPR
jgi:ubiquinone/menaquinone biosynthesis C-methylase UbiE